MVVVILLTLRAANESIAITKSGFTSFIIPLIMENVSIPVWESTPGETQYTPFPLSIFSTVLGPNASGVA